MEHAHAHFCGLSIRSVAIQMQFSHLVRVFSLVFIVQLLDLFAAKIHTSISTHLHKHQNIRCVGVCAAIS